MSALQFSAAILFTTMICGTASPSLSPFPFPYCILGHGQCSTTTSGTAFAAILLLDMSYLTQLSIYLAPANPTRAIGCGEMSQKKTWKEEELAETTRDSLSSRTKADIPHQPASCSSSNPRGKSATHLGKRVPQYGEGRFHSR